jgi:hypothetical protein
MGARHWGGIGFSYRPARLHRLAEFIPRNQFRGPINIWKYGLRLHRLTESIPGLLKSLMIQPLEQERRKIRLIESNAKCRYLKKVICKGTLPQAFICMRPLPLLGFCLGWCSNFVGSESGQKLLQSMISAVLLTMRTIQTTYLKLDRALLWVDMLG